MGAPCLSFVGAESMHSGVGRSESLSIPSCHWFDANKSHGGAHRYMETWATENYKVTLGDTGHLK